MSGSDLIPEAGGGIVAVELEYRLGVFGSCFLSNPILSLWS